MTKAQLQRQIAKLLSAEKNLNGKVKAAQKTMLRYPNLRRQLSAHQIGPYNLAVREYTRLAWRLAYLHGRIDTLNLWLARLH